MSRPYYDQGYGGGIPEPHSSDETARQRQNIHPSSRIPRPGLTPDRIRGSPVMVPNFSSASPMHSPRRSPAHQPYPPTVQSTRQTPEHQLYDSNPYEYQEDYGQNDQWPLHAQSPARATQDPTNSSRMTPRRPARPDEAPRQLDYRQHDRDPPRHMPPMMPTNRQPYHGHPPSHHGNGQWTGEGYSYAPPPNYPLPNRPLPPDAATSTANFSALPAYPPPQVPQQAAYQVQENRRPPLGPPPSARRGPPSYYPQVGPVHPILEETDSMRGSMRTGSVNTGGRDSKTSFASSNAIPIGISQTHLERGREVKYQPVQRPAPLSDTEDEEEDYDDSPTEPAIARGEIRTPDYMHRHDQASPEHGIVRQASLGKRSKPTLTTVKSSDQVRRSGGEAKSSLAGLPSQQQSSTRAEPPAFDISERTERARALAQEMLEGQAQPGASSVQQQQYADSDQQQPSTTAAVTGATASYMQETPLDQKSTKPTPEEAFRSGSALLDASSDSESNSNASLHIRRQRSRELLGAELANQLHPQRSTARSPLAPAVDPRVESIIGSLEKGGAISAAEAEELKQPMGGMSERAGKRRPPRLNVDAVKEAEARGSLTSLSDLIRRATKLASNLDRGKTASRMGMNWIDGAGADEKKHRSGSMSDILSAFPPPALATSPGSRNGFRRSLANWSVKGDRHSALPSDSDAGAIKRRRCCGMPLWVLVCLIVLLILLVAAAVVVPVVLIVLPRQEDAVVSKVGTCAAKLVCANGGTNILGSNGICECLCVNGYTGSTCATYQQSGCSSISAGPSSNATIGESLPRLLSSAASTFSIPLDTQELLGLFSSADMSCNVQNQLVTFNGRSTRRWLVPSSEVRAPSFNGIVTAREDSSSSSPATDDASLNAPSTPSALSAPTPATSATSTTTTTTAAGDVNSKTLDFARVAVLYIFQTSRVLHIAADAQDNLQSYFRSGDTTDQQPASANNITLGNGYVADLTTFSLITSNGTTVGGRPIRRL